MRSLYPGTVIAMLLTSFLLVGCGPRTYPVGGKVIYPNGKPMKGGGRIVFLPVEPNQVSAVGYIDNEGTIVGYTLNPSPPDGISPGKYRVGVIGNQETPSGASPHIAERFSDPTTSGLEVEIKAEPNQLTIEVTK
jgi:hypothetical protein